MDNEPERQQWWRHQMETFSALLAICAGNSPFTGEFPAHKGQWNEALMLSLICDWINSWVNNREAGDFRRNRTHYDVTVINEAEINEALGLTFALVDVGFLISICKILIIPDWRLLTHLPTGKHGVKITDDNNSVQFRLWKLVTFDNCFIEVCSLGCDWWEVIIGLDNCLASNRRQAIIWNNDDIIYWRIYESLSFCYLKPCQCFYVKHPGSHLQKYTTLRYAFANRHWHLARWHCIMGDTT